MMTNQLEDFEHSFFNVAKLIIPERSQRTNKNSSQCLTKPKLKKISTVLHKMSEKQPKEHAKIELPTIKLKTLRQTQKTISSEKTEVTSHKKLTNLSKYNQQQNSRDQEDTEVVKKIRTSQRMNLGLKKQKGKMNEYMRNILMRTKIDDEITIKRSPFQSDFRSNQHRSPRATSLDQKNTDSQDHPGQHIQRKVFSQNKIKNIKNNLNNRKPANHKNDDVELPNVNEHRNIVQMVKMDEKRKQKLREARRKQEERDNSEYNEQSCRKSSLQKVQLVIKNIENETIPEEIQYSTNQQREDGEISEAIQNSSKQD